MQAAQVREVVECRAAVVLPVDGVVDLGADRATIAAREPAGAIAHLEPPLEVSRRPVAGAVDIEHGARHRVREDAGERRRLRGEPPRGVGVDRPVAVEQPGILGCADEREHRHRDVHAGASGGDRLGEVGFARQPAVQEQVACGVGAELRGSAMIAACVGACIGARVSRCSGVSDPVEPIFDEQRVGRWQQCVQPRHAVASRLDLHPSFGEGCSMPLGDGLDLELLAKRTRPATQGGGRRGLGHHGQPFVEPRAHGGVLEADRLIDDHARVTGADPPVAHRGERGRQHGRQRPRLGDPVLHRALGHSKRRGELGRDGSARQVVSTLWRDRGRYERRLAAHRISDGEIDQVDLHCRVHRLHALRLNRRVDQLAKAVLRHRVGGTDVGSGWSSGLGERAACGIRVTESHAPSLAEIGHRFERSEKCGEERSNGNSSEDHLRG